ncbi:MAG: SPOR domain-containing protein [Roseateles asaccharophilus]|uniref:DedD protein n=1 Tax=Roseateles asaccharophilus TaxID=582607 RepID=A0A4R6N3M9_9BURK|nr:SPOR domain-containing protein [Roseateles asaccharophilus]MDN3544755.1 SPOR domain-containing protein [Roseateles asaccharophilus]TDP09478.1 DedD protein [Roseateles asaccharophilus]
MGLLSSLFKRNTAAPAAKPVSESASDVQQLRVRARRRLIGAAVLVGLGVIGFPLVFETQPRPIPVDLPIDIPRKEGAAPLPIPAAPVPAPEVQPATRPAAPPLVIQEPVAEAKPAQAQAREEILPRISAQAASEAKPQPKAETKVEPKLVAKPEPKPEPRKEVAAQPAASKATNESRDASGSKEAARVQALLEGKKPEAAPGRYIVQVGAYADSKAAQEARMKVERQGIKTYTQAVDTAEGQRIRVRVGPFPSREEADKVAAKLRSGGLSTAVLSL